MTIRENAYNLPRERSRDRYEQISEHVIVRIKVPRPIPRTKHATQYHGTLYGADGSVISIGRSPDFQTLWKLCVKRALELEEVMK